MINYEESLAQQTEEIMKKCDDLLKTSIDACGISALDMNAETGAMIGGCMEIYKDSKDLYITLAGTIDKMVKDFKELKSMNEKLYKQNEELQKMLQEINKKIGK